MALTANDMSQLTGLEQLRENKRTPLWPKSIDKTLGIEFDEIDDGIVSISLVTRPDFANMVGMVQGGICATMLDMAMGCAVQTTLEAGTGYATLGLNINYVRPVSVDAERLTCVGTVLHRGTRTATAEGRIYDSSSKLVSHGTTTCYIMS